MVLSGLLMGAREFAIYGMATIAAQGALAGIWFMGGVQDLQLSETQLENKAFNFAAHLSSNPK